MKKKLLLMIVALMCAVGSWAVNIDYTSKVGTGQSDWTGASGIYGVTVTPRNASEVNMVEKYFGDNSVSGANTPIFSQTVTGLPNGTYTVVLYATANNARCPEANGGIQSNATDLVYVYAGSDKTHKTYLTSRKAESYTTPDEYTIVGVVTDGTLEIGMYAEKTGTQWQTIQIKSLTLMAAYYSTSNLESNGWTKITALPSNVDDYYFMFIDASTSSLALANRTEYGNQNSVGYTNLSNPLFAEDQVWILEKNSDNYKMKNLDGVYIDCGSDGWNYSMGASPSYPNFEFAYADSKWSLTRAGGNNGDGRLVGPWEASRISNGIISLSDANIPNIPYDRVAFNKTSSNAPGFLIYSISRTAYNASVELGSAKLENLGWEQVTEKSQLAVDGYKYLLLDVSESGDESGLVMAGNTSWLHYEALSETPLSNTEQLWTIETDGTYYAFKNVAANNYLFAWWNSWEGIVFHESINGWGNEDNGCYFDCALSDGKFTLTSCKYSDAGFAGRYATQTSAPFDGERIAFNKSAGSGKKQYLIYRWKTATSDDYEALNTAIPSYTLGFEVGEYAPYKNVDAVEALALAKSINQSGTNSKATVDAAIAALEGATWTANAERMNAFYDGGFANTAIGSVNTTGVPGWTTADVNNMRAIMECAYFTGGRGLYIWPVNIKYGETTGYTLPLEANSIYRFSYSYAGQGNTVEDSPEVSILSSNNYGLPLTETGAGAPKYDAGAKTFTIYFLTGNTKEDYVFTYYNPAGANSIIGDLSLVKVDALPLSESASINFVAGTYPTVALDRTFSTANLSTMVLPFALDAAATSAAFEKVYELESVTGVTMHFNTVSSITAGTPYLVKAKSSSLSASNVALDPATTVSDKVVEDGTSTVTFKGTFSPIEKLPAGSYIVSSNALYEVDEDVDNYPVSINAYRGYFTVAAIGGVKNFVLSFDDTTDTINMIEDAKLDDETIYNLAGQRVNKAQKGIYIVNGKKVLVK